MRDHLGDLAWLDTVIERRVQVIRHLDCLVSGDEYGQRDDAAVARRETRTFPYLSEKAVMCVPLEGWCDHSDVFGREHWLTSWTSLRLGMTCRCGDEQERRQGRGNSIHRLPFIPMQTAQSDTAVAMSRSLFIV